MGFRATLAERYGAVRAPETCLFREALNLASSRPSNSLLPGTRVSRNALFSLQATEVSDCPSGLAVPAADSRQFSANLSVPALHERSELIGLQVQGSENLLTPICGPEPKGKDYARQEETARLFDEFEEPKHAQAGRRKAYREVKTSTGTLRKHLGIWDLILPLLKPPLTLDFPTQIDLPFELYPYQIPGVQRLVENDSFLLADEMGTGKTVMSSVALRILFQQGRIRQALVICPKSAISVWDSHLEDWAGPDIQCTVVGGSREAREQDWKYAAHVYVSTFDSFKNDVLPKSAPLYPDEERKRFDLVIVDEAHHIRNAASKRSKALRSLKPKIRWALTGTPLQKDVGDLSAIFGFVKPGLFPSEPPSPAKARKLIAPFFLRRRKTDVLKDLPEKIRQDIWLELDSEQRAAYEDTLEDGRRGWSRVQDSVGSMRTHIFSLIGRLKQICNFAPGATSSPKIECLLEQLDEILEENKACVFTQYKAQGLDKLRPHLRRYGLVEIHGQASQNQRATAIKEFQTNPDVRVFVATTKSGGEGITLTAGNYAFHFDQWWNPATAWQAEDRLHRSGQKQQVNVYSFWMTDTYEERIYALLRDKGLLFEEIIDSLSESEVDSQISIEEWCQVLGLEVKHAAKATEQKAPSKKGTGLGEIYRALREVTPNRFEQVVAEVFRYMGYGKARVTGGAYDAGVDIRATRNGPGGPEQVVVQCKRREQVGVDVARELLGTVTADARIAKGFLVVSGRLSPACRQFISEHGSLASMEGFELAKRLIEFGVHLGTEDS